MKRLIILAIATVATASAAFSEVYQPCPWERQIVAACLVLEASNQGEVGMQAVASVIANRAQRDSSRYIQVVKRPYAFSALNTATTGRTGSVGYAGHVQRASRDSSWTSALRIVDQLYENSLSDVTYGADHYSRADQLPNWSHRMRATTIIGDHLFFRAK